MYVRMCELIHIYLYVNAYTYVYIYLRKNFLVVYWSRKPPPAHTQPQQPIKIHTYTPNIQDCFVSKQNSRKKQEKSLTSIALKLYIIPFTNKEVSIQKKLISIVQFLWQLYKIVARSGKFLQILWCCCKQ